MIFLIVFTICMKLAARNQKRVKFPLEYVFKIASPFLISLQQPKTNPCHINKHHRRKSPFASYVFILILLNYCLVNFPDKSLL